jgi:hypothetical protein
MLIADTQVHIWAAETPERPWPKGHHDPHRPVPFSKVDLFREAVTMFTEELPWLKGDNLEWVMGADCASGWGGSDNSD